MRKTIILLLFIISLQLCYCQVNDTIFLKNGQIFPVYKILGEIDDLFWYYLTETSKRNGIDPLLVDRYSTQEGVITLSKNREIKPVYNDTIFFKTGEKYPVYKIRRINDKIITFNVDPILMSSIDIKLVDGYYSNSLIDKNKHDLEYYKANQNLPEIDYEIGRVKHNLERFYKQKRASHICMGAGIISGVVFGLNPLENTIFGYIAGGLSLASFVIDIDSYKWIKRASLETNANSVTLKVNF